MGRARRGARAQAGRQRAASIRHASKTTTRTLTIAVRQQQQQLHVGEFEEELERIRKTVWEGSSFQPEKSEKPRKQLRNALQPRRCSPMWSRRCGVADVEMAGCHGRAGGQGNGGVAKQQTIKLAVARPAASLLFLFSLPFFSLSRSAFRSCHSFHSFAPSSRRKRKRSADLQVTARDRAKPWPGSFGGSRPARPTSVATMHVLCPKL